MSRMFEVEGKRVKTWSPQTGCNHNCVYCYARKMSKDSFEPFFHADRLKTFKKGFIFVCSMADLFGDWVATQWIESTLDTISKSPKASFLFLTKNPKRYLEFNFPPNVILGATIETDIYHAGISQAPAPASRLTIMGILAKDLPIIPRMVAIEPILDFSPSFVGLLARVKPQFVYVGYDNHGYKLPEPLLEKTMVLIAELGKFTEVRTKTIRKAWWE